MEFRRTGIDGMVMELLMNNPNGLSLNRIFNSKIAAKTTLQKTLGNLIKAGLVSVDKALIKGHADTYRFTERGFEAMNENRLNPASFISIKIELDKRYWDCMSAHRGREEAERIKNQYQTAVKDPYIQHELANLLSLYAYTYLESFFRKTAIDGRLLKDSRFSIIVNIPKEFGLMIKQLEDEGRIKDDSHAAKIIIDTGLSMIGNIYKNKDVAKEMIISARFYKFNNGLVSDVPQNELPYYREKMKQQILKQNN